MTVNRKKRAAIAIAIAAVLLLGGTFAWQSISQTALNEASGTVNPGGRLHDDFDGSNKDVYVENFADDDIFARIRLDEYFEIVANQDTEAEQRHEIVGEYVDGRKVGETFIFGQEENAHDEYWDWETGGQTVYMPTFNKNKDSIEADINGTYDKDPEKAYTDYTVYLEGQTEIGDEIYDIDTDSVDEYADGTAEVDKDIKIISGQTHTAMKTETASLISMEEWLDMVESDGGYDQDKHGNYWVYDEDGWVYWSAPIPGGGTTGLLLDGIVQKQVIDDSWYYSIDVVAQFITADDLGLNDDTGFYDTTNGDLPPSEDALNLLKIIGVDTATFVDDEANFETALAEGKDISLKGAITSTEPSNDTNLNTDYNILWTEGGTLSGGKINTENGHMGFFINNENNWPVDGDGANAVTIDGTAFVSKNNDAAVYVQAIDAPVTLKNLKVTTERAGIYAEHADKEVTLEACTVASSNQSPDEYYWLNSAVAAAHGANVVINSGTYTAKYAAYVFSSGGTITINGGHFDGELKADAGELIVKGGTFTTDPTDFVADGYAATEGSNGVWAVAAK